MGQVKATTSKQTSLTRWVEGRYISSSEWHNVRCGVWFLASELVSLDYLQLFAKTVEPTDPLDIRRTAEILARAQLELRRLNNQRYSTSSSRKSAAKT